MAIHNISLPRLRTLHGEINSNLKNVNLIVKMHFDNSDMEAFILFRTTLPSCGHVAVVQQYTRIFFFVLNYGKLFLHFMDQQGKFLQLTSHPRCCVSLVLWGGDLVFLFVPDVSGRAHFENEFYRKYRPLRGEIVTGCHFTNLTVRKVRLALTCHVLACPRGRCTVKRVLRVNLYTVNLVSWSRFNNMLASIAWVVGYLWCYR